MTNNNINNNDNNNDSYNNDNNNDSNNDNINTNDILRPETHFSGCRLGWFPTMQKKKPRLATVALAQRRQCTQASV